jgi:hypothetical protein
MLFRYFLPWFGMMFLAIINGGLRDKLYAPFLGELLAHQLSTLLLVVVFAGYFWLLTTFWRIASSRQAWSIGLMWLVMTLMFEIGLGRWGLGYTWSRVVHDVDIMVGRVWVLIPLWVLVGPLLFFRIRKGR